MAGAEVVTILLVEDDPADQKLIRKSLENQSVGNQPCIVSSGEEAMDFLYCRGDYSSGSPRPDLIMLDLNMPGMGGKEFLSRIKADSELAQIPVVILTTSKAERDIIDSYKLHASGYVNKPLTLNDFDRVMEKISDYWFVVCKQPPKEPPSIGSKAIATEGAHLRR